MHGDDDGLDDLPELPDLSGSNPPPRRSSDTVVRRQPAEWYEPATLEALRRFAKADARAVGALEARAEAHATRADAQDARITKAEDGISKLSAALCAEQIATWKLRVALGVLGGGFVVALVVVAVLRPDLAKGIGAFLGAVF